jgi:hypothetical protein
MVAIMSATYYVFPAKQIVSIPMNTLIRLICNNQATASNVLFLLKLFKITKRKAVIFVSFVYKPPSNRDYIG